MSFRLLAELVAVVPGLLVFLCSDPSLAKAAQFDIFTPPDNFVLDEPTSTTSGALTKVYSPTGANPHWHIAQWSIPGGKLPSFTRSAQGGGQVFSSQATEASVQIVQNGSQPAITLSQSGGSVLPCSTSSGKPRESDLFVAAAGRNSEPPLQAASTQPDGKSPPLASLRQLIQQVDFKGEIGSGPNPNGCEVNQGGAIISIIMNDTEVKPAQVNFYQMNVLRVCGAGPAKRVAMCRSTGSGMHYYAKANPFGTTDHLDWAGQSMATPGAEANIRIDLLPRLLEAIRSGPDTMDHDPSHWRVNGVYFGQLIFGDVMVKTAWKNYHLSAVTAN